ncbi:YbjQ family protein [Candidatus Methanoprimaticola sp. MG2]|uniref:YbjQ family protein n=1 Tax=Candidatus Methanoprimaticola sp. MG2 TaxID=3228838 RepID=UPI0039C657B4
MLLTTTENIPGKSYEILGIAKGNMIQTKNIGRDIGQGLKSMVGGELSTYTEMMNEARAVATKRMVEDAERLGADAVVMMRYSTSTVAAGAAEVIAYGTAVRYV